MPVNVFLFCFYHGYDLDCLKIVDKNYIWREDERRGRQGGGITN